MRGKKSFQSYIKILLKLSWKLKKLKSALIEAQLLCFKGEQQEVIVELNSHLPPLLHGGNVAWDERKSFICC